MSKKKKKSEPIKTVRLIDQVLQGLRKNGHKISDTGVFGDGSSAWVDVRQERGDMYIDISIGFSGDGQEIQSIDVFQGEIKTVYTEATNILKRGDV